MRNDPTVDGSFARQQSLAKQQSSPFKYCYSFLATPSPTHPTQPTTRQFTFPIMRSTRHGQAME
jgi:hypothetical protein